MFEYYFLLRCGLLYSGKKCSKIPEVSVASVFRVNCKQQRHYYFQLTYCSLQSLLCVSTRVTTREHPASEGGTVGGKCPGILPKCRLPRYI